MTTTPPRLALVTGAARGIGAAIATTLVDDGFLVVATDINEEGLARTAASRPDRMETAYLDVRSTPAVDAFAAHCQARHGRGFDVVVNNAGFATTARLDDIDDEHWLAVLDLNLMSMMRVCRATVPGMRAAGGGSIVCLTSIAGHSIGWPGHLAYSAAKAGIAGLVRTLAMELAPDGIRVNGIAPAGLHAKASDVPLGRVGTDQDIADTVSLFTGDRTAFVTGQVLSVDGGMSVAL